MSRLLRALWPWAELRYLRGELERTQCRLSLVEDGYRSHRYCTFPLSEPGRFRAVRRETQ